MLFKILAGLAAIIVIFVIVVAMQPSEFQVSRSATIAAPPADVFAHVNDLRAWQQWSPWAKLDPNCKVTFSGPESGDGAVFAWAGNAEVGEGKMTITESKPVEMVSFRLDFVKPFEGTNDATFTFQPEPGDQTRVTWSMSGKSNFMFKAVGLFMDCDKMLGDQFETGLAQLKTVAEAPKN